MNLHIEAAGPLVTVQDLGRHGWQRYGVPVSGAMDGLALRAANVLVGNPWAYACLEIGLGELAAIPDGPCVVALAGCGVTLRIGGHPIPLWAAAFARAGEPIEIRRTGWGWAYLAIQGGIDVPIVLGSRSTYLRGAFGGYAGRSLQSGDSVRVGDAPLRAEMAWREMRPPIYNDSDSPIVSVVRGPQADRFTQGALEAMFSSEYTITLASDRMGYRLAGPPLIHRAGADIVSEGVALGTIQVPADGQPILMMSDHATTGGYTKIATITTLDTWRAAQCTPGAGRLRFMETTAAAAQTDYRRVLGTLNAAVIDYWQEAITC